MRNMKNAMIASVVALSLLFGCVPVKALNARFTLKYLKDAPTTDWVTSYSKSGIATRKYVIANVNSITRGAEAGLLCEGYMDGSLSSTGCITSDKVAIGSKIKMKAWFRVKGNRARVEGSFDY